ncbi:MAG: amino acid permease [Bifidobacteriaceae bacterium]|jgi:D-serine/D-alanine/glycine transporter|nr:amino acid permease [Bifidobacteriaceae bacterium]
MIKSDQTNTLHRDLKNRHIQLLAIGGTIGTGLFLGVHKTISVGGPSIILSYIIAGLVCYFAMRCLGEMLIASTKFRSFREVVSYYLSDGAGFVVGCIYWLVWIVAGILDSLAVGIYLNPFLPFVPDWAIPSLVVLILFLINIGSVKFFGEAEFWLAIIKIFAILATIVIGLFLIISGYKYIFIFTNDFGIKQQDALTAQIQNLWQFGGFFPNGVMGFLLGFQMAFLAFAGIESLAVTAGETSNPAKTLPRAIKNLPIRIGLFYVGSIFIILSCVPWNEILLLQGSPFATIFGSVGMPQIEIIMTIVLVTAASSGANGGLYISSRMLYGLSTDGQMPKFFSKITKYGVPITSLLFSGAIILLTDIAGSFIFSDPMEGFAVFASWATVSILITWIFILITYISYRKKFGEIHKKNIFKAPAGRTMSVICLLFFVAIFLTMFFDKDMIKGIYLTFICLVIILLIYILFIRAMHKKSHT